MIMNNPKHCSWRDDIESFGSLPAGHLPPTPRDPLIMERIRSAAVVKIRIASVHDDHHRQHDRQQQQVDPGMNAIGNAPDPSRRQANAEP